MIQVNKLGRSVSSIQTVNHQAHLEAAEKALAQAKMHAENLAYNQCQAWSSIAQAHALIAQAAK